MNVCFDVLGTLVDENGTPRPQTREVFLNLTGMGHDVYLWSSGGEYAARAARVLGVEDMVKGWRLKRHPPEGFAVDYAVDDDEGVVGEYGGQLVSAYRGDPEDAELLAVVEALCRRSGIWVTSKVSPTGSVPAEIEGEQAMPGCSTPPERQPCC